MTGEGPMSDRTLTVDDVKRRAEEVRDLAVHEVRQATAADPAKLLAAGVLGVLVIASVAYYLGSRKCPACGPAEL